MIHKIDPTTEFVSAQLPGVYPDETIGVYIRILTHLSSWSCRYVRLMSVDMFVIGVMSLLVTFSPLVPLLLLPVKGGSAKEDPQARGAVEGEGSVPDPGALIMRVECIIGL